MESAVSSDGVKNSAKKQRVFARRVVICGSMAFSAHMERVAKHLADYDVLAVLPDDKDMAAEMGGQGGYEQFKRAVSRAHIAKVRDPRTVGILVVNFDKRGIKSYIGPNTFAEIAIAFADRKKVYLLNGIPGMYADELSAWGVTDLAGNLEKVAEQLRQTCRTEQKSEHNLEKTQLKLPLS